MECVICNKDAKYRTVKGTPVCRDCQESLKVTRDHLNSTRTNPKHNLNPLGQPPVTLREVVLRAIHELSQKESVNETT